MGYTFHNRRLASCIYCCRALSKGEGVFVSGKGYRCPGCSSRARRVKTISGGDLLISLIVFLITTCFSIIKWIFKGIVYIIKEMLKKPEVDNETYKQYQK